MPYKVIIPQLPTGDSSDEGDAINASGYIVGSASDPANSATAVLWSPAGTATTLQNIDPSNAGAHYGAAVAINNAGESVGSDTLSMEVGHGRPFGRNLAR